MVQGHADRQKGSGGQPMEHGARRICLVLLLTTALFAVDAARAYEPDIHQQLTFIAAKQFDRCIEGTDLDQLTPLEIRYIVRTNAAEAESGFWRNLVTSRFYDRSEADDHTFLWLIRTRMNPEFEQALEDLQDAEGFAERYANLGRLVSHLQTMTSPVYAVPIYYSRWWRLSTTEPFNSYAVDVGSLERRLEGSCSLFMSQPPTDPTRLLRQTAARTVDALSRPIDGMPASWEAFWETADAGSFGRYGPAGNRFGQATTFRCNGTDCVMRNGDPRYQEFALDRHFDAVVATMRAMYWKQWRKRDRMRGPAGG